MKELKRDRAKICEIISEMLDNPDDIGIYPTSIAYKKLAEYIQQERLQAIGWTHAEACMAIDKDKDFRKVLVPDMLDRAFEDLD